MRLRLFILTLMCVAASLAVAQNGQQSIEIDPSSFRPVQTDALTGVNIDPIGKDRSQRPCARIKLHINRMTREEIEQVVIQPIGGNVALTKRMVAYEGNGLIFELTAKKQTRFYLHHDKYGDSNEVSLNLEGDKEYMLDAQLNLLLPIVVSTNIKGAGVYVDNEFKGTTGDDFTLTVKDVIPGAHKIAVAYGAARNEQTVEVNSNNISFRIPVNSSVARPQFVIFEVEPKSAMVMIGEKAYNVQDGVAQILLQNGTYNYRVVAQGYHEESDTLTVAGSKIIRKVSLKADIVDVVISSVKGSEIWINNECKGSSPWRGQLLTGTYIFEARKAGCQPTLLPQEITSEPAEQSYTLDAPTPMQGAFQITTKPIGADVVVDGKSLGHTPIVADLMAGKHRIVVSKEGYATIEKQIEMRDGDALELNFELAPAKDFYTPGKALYDAQKYPEAVEEFRKGADQGDMKSECWLGLCYYRGHGVNKSYDEAVAYFERSAEKGFAEAQYRLARCYFDGVGVEKNSTNAAKLIYKAAMQGHKAAQRKMASCYESGTGVPRDINKAIIWYQIASGQMKLQ